MKPRHQFISNNPFYLPYINYMYVPMSWKIHWCYMWYQSARCRLGTSCVWYIDCKNKNRFSTAAIQSEFEMEVRDNVFGQNCVRLDTVHRWCVTSSYYLGSGYFSVFISLITRLLLLISSFLKLITITICCWRETKHSAQREEKKTNTQGTHHRTRGDRCC